MPVVVLIVLTMFLIFGCDQRKDGIPKPNTPEHIKRYG